MRAFAALAVLLVAFAPTASAMMSVIENASTRGATVAYYSSIVPSMTVRTPGTIAEVPSYVPTPRIVSDPPVDPPVDAPSAQAAVGVQDVVNVEGQVLPQFQVESREAKAYYHLEAKVKRLELSYVKHGALQAPATSLPTTPLATPLVSELPPVLHSFAPEAPAPVPETTPGERRVDVTIQGEEETVASWTSAVAAASLGLALLVHFLLYHRMRGNAVLENGTRERLLTMLRERPGLAPADAARELGIDPSTALYHLRRLVKEGIAVVDGAPRVARYFAVGTVAPEERARVVAERDGAPFLTLIRTEPGVSKTRLAERAAIARATVSWHLERLHKAGLVRFEREGREVKVYPASA